MTSYMTSYMFVKCASLGIFAHIKFITISASNTYNIAAFLLVS